jgi:hypothetical protein
MMTSNHVHRRLCFVRAFLFGRILFVREYFRPAFQFSLLLILFFPETFTVFIFLSTT